MKSGRRKLFQQLRDKHPTFVYEGFSCAVNKSQLIIIFEFELENGPSFRPFIKIPLPANSNQDILSDSLIRNIIFNMGMVELVSYWKSACPPKVVINAMGLSKDQLLWWKNLYLHGLGEFFYENAIVAGEDFMEIEADGEPDRFVPVKERTNDVLIPLGGGKDSAVSLEILKQNYRCLPLIINPREASLQTAYKAGFTDEEVIKVSRRIDPELLELNGKGYLNGHTPFSAMLAFTSLLVAELYNAGEIALSNESSANEPTIPGTGINHQYSKSLEFERDFRNYANKYTGSNKQYYSYLRPLNELQISGLFSGLIKQYPTFRSCNVGSKTNAWCGECPKCLFTYIMLSVFIDEKGLIAIFGENLLNKENLLESFEQLCGFADEKPFECVGTIEEVNVALRKIIFEAGDKKLPFLLQQYKGRSRVIEHDPAQFRDMLSEFQDHCIPDPDKVKLLKQKLSAL